MMENLNRAKQMIGTLNWSKEDIETLKEYFLKGVSIKLIAKEMGRTPGAVNKALTRFNIRTPRIFKERIIKNQDKLNNIRLQREREFMAKIRWTTLTEVINWLDQVGDSVMFSGGRFLINYHPMTKMQLVMHANKKRLEKGDEIFLVENVTW